MGSLLGQRVHLVLVCGSKVQVGKNESSKPWCVNTYPRKCVSNCAGIRGTVDDGNTELDISVWNTVVNYPSVPHDPEGSSQMGLIRSYNSRGNRGSGSLA